MRMYMTDPYVNAIYTSPQGLEFKITALPYKDSDPWVEFKNSQTNQAYSCRLEAFLARYTIRCE